MNQKSFKITKEEIDNIISVAYGSADKSTENYVSLLLSESKEARKIFKSYKKTAEAVHSIKLPEVPVSLDKLADDLTRPKANSCSFYKTIGYLFKEPLTVFAFAAVFAVIIFTSLLSPLQNKYNGFTSEELLKANREVLAALGFVGRVLNETENTLTKKILYKEIGKPISESINTIDKLLNRGGKNEK